MDIAIIIPSLSQHGGAERVVVRSASYLMEKGHQVTIYTAEHRAKYLEENGCAAARVVTLSGWGSTLERFNMAPVRWQREIGRHDVYISHLFPTGKMQLSPMVAYPHEPFRLLRDLKTEIPAWEPSTKDVLAPFIGQTPYSALPSRLHVPEQDEIDAIDETGRAQPEVMLANSHRTSAYIKSIYGSARVDVVYPACDPVLHPRWDFPEWWGAEIQSARPFRVLMVGAVAYLKRWRLAIDAVSLLPNVELYLVGQGPDLFWARNAVEKLGLSDRVFVLGQVSDDTVERLWQRVDASLMCSLREPFGIFPLESAAHGVPCVVDADAGVIEVLEGGCLPSESTPQALATALLTLASDRDLYRGLAQRGRAIAQDQTWDSFGEQLESALVGAVRIANVRGGRVAPRPLLSYRIDYGIGDQERFAPYLPALGRYGSHEGWVIERHLRSMLDMGASAIALEISGDNDEIVGRTARIAERVCDIAKQMGTGQQFSLSLNMDTLTRSQAVGLIRFWRAARLPNKLVDECGLPIICLRGNAESAIKGVWMAAEETHLFHTGASVLNVLGQDIPPLRVAICANDEARQRIAALLRDGGDGDWLLLDGFNNFPQHRYLEAVVNGPIFSRNRNLLINGDFAHWPPTRPLEGANLTLYSSAGWHFQTGMNGSQHIQRTEIDEGARFLLPETAHAVKIQQVTSGSYPCMGQFMPLEKRNGPGNMTLSFWARASRLAELQATFSEYVDKSVCAQHFLGVSAVGPSWMKYVLVVQMPATQGEYGLLSIGLPSGMTFGLEITELQWEVAEFASDFHRRPPHETAYLCEQQSATYSLPAWDF